ncbi:MAG: hypothetical protein LUG16_00515, partial [Candidatus Gastranaerophilales bacterium]|nr:hypothetical protein [Candidatus Gastranaerophilales bacterium]
YIMGNTDKNKISKKNIDIKDINIEDIDDKVRDADITIEKWQIKVNQIKRGKLKIENILLSGMFKDNIFNFTTKDIKFAKGFINANGKINFQSGESEIDFAANNIDSDTVADAIFNMPNQIKGLAGASLKAKMKHNFQDINAHADFYIKEGYLPQLGSTEFIIKKSKKVKRPIKIKLSEITNIDMSKNEALVSDISGSFDMDNDDLSNICLFAQQSFLSLFIEGDYDISQSYARMNIWGKYDVIAHRKIKILFVPVSLIFKIIFRPEKTKELYTDKLQKIPPIESTPENERVFRVNIEGNLNDKDIKVDLKSLI